MRRFIISVFAVLSLAMMGLAQSNTGNLTVNVSDASGVIPGATVVLTDNATGRERTFTTTSEGAVTFSQLEVGTYTVKISAPNRKTNVYPDVKVDIGVTRTLTAVLDAGKIEEVVEIVGGADLINATNGEISTTVGSRQIQELPLNGRNPLALISLQAGSSSNGATNTVINGQRTSFTSITRDGLNVQDNFIRSNATDFVPDRPNVDDVGEFTITNQNAGVEAGYGASQISLATPRGQNDFTGALYIYNRNSRFQANTFFNNLNNVRRPFLNRNQFGGRLAGPILKNKLFFFGAYEGFRLRQSTNTIRTTLTASARQGLFTYINNAGATRQVNLFSLTQQVPSGSPITGIDPLVASRILANLPTGNTFGGDNNLNTTGFAFNQLQNQDREAVTTRFDFDMNSKNTLSTIYSWRDEFLLRPDVDNGGFNQIPFGNQVARTYTTNSAWRYTPNANLTNEVRVALQLSRPAFDRDNAPTNFFFTTPLISSPESTFQAQGRNTATWLVRDDAVYTTGNHSIRFGGSANWFRINPFGPPAFANSTIPTVALGTNLFTPQFQASAFSDGITGPQLGTANGLLALLGGIVSSVGQTFNVRDQTSGFLPNLQPERRLHYEYYSFYAGDSWRVNQNFTLNYGVRYENFTPISEPSGLVLEPVIKPGQDIVSAILDPTGTYNFVGTNNGDNRLFKPDNNNLAPNISFAWSPSFSNGLLSKLFPGGNKTVIRGGFSVSFVNDEFVRSADNALINNAGLTQPVTVANLNQRLSTFANPITTAPTFAVPRTYAQNNALAANFGTVFAVDPNIQTPSLYQYNIGIQRELPWKMALEIRYVGNNSGNLLRGVDFNQVRIFENGFFADFQRARANMLATGSTPANPTAGNPNCAPPTAGCTPLTLIPTLGSGGLLNNANVRNLIFGGAPADLAFTYITSNLAGASQLFLANPNTGVANLIDNTARSKYDALQVELRRRFSGGIFFQANYTLGKALTDASGVGQTRFDPLIDNANRANEYARADFDTEHVINFNTIYELPFGKGKRFLNAGGFMDQIFGGWQVTSIVRFATGAPILITDPRGTLNRGGRSGRQTASSPLTNQEISNLIGVFRTPCGVFWLNPAVININQTALQNGNCNALGSGRGSEGFGQATFGGQVFFNNAPGQTGNMARNAWNGPFFFNADASMFKNFRIGERMRLQVRAEGFNIFNRANFTGAGGNINSTTFGRLFGTRNGVEGVRIMQGVLRFEF